ncbi:MAG: glycosyltransferase [Candidatus Parcubacteria bacterium]|nr:glycosyltransferase [Candidatus Parcubacteria bacterium]
MEVIMFNMSSYAEWQRGVSNRNFHICQSFLKDSRVSRLIAVDFLPFTFKRAVRSWLEGVMARVRGKIIYQDLTTRAQRINDNLIVFSTIDSLFSGKRVIQKLNLVLNKLNQSQHKEKRIVVSYFPMFVEQLGRLNQDLDVFEAVDNWLEHPSYLKYRELLQKNYQTIAEKADLIFTVAESLVDFFKSLGRVEDTYWAPNGVDAEHFARASEAAPKDISKIPHPIVGYLGTIQNRVDADLLEHLAQNNPDKSLVLIGPTWPEFLKWLRPVAPEIKRLKKYPNVYFLGRKSYQEAPSYIKQFDVAIIPHKLDKFIQFTHSMKLFDYLACGKPVVTTPPSGVDKFSHLVYIAQDYAEFNQNMQKALIENNDELIKLRIAAARENSWQNRFKQITNHIDKKLR